MVDMKKVLAYVVMTFLIFAVSLVLAYIFYGGGVGFLATKSFKPPV